jgi:hypothetical protein
MHLILAKKGLGYILGDFVANSSGHPGSGRPANSEIGGEKKFNSVSCI